MQREQPDFTSHEHRVGDIPRAILLMPLISTHVRWTHGRSNLGSSRIIFLRPRGRTKGALWLVISIQMVSRSMKTIRTEHGIAVDFCYPDSEELSLICPECGINSVGIFPPEITDGDRGFRGIVVTIRCECENLHTFSVVFGQHKSITFVRTDLTLLPEKSVRASQVFTSSRLRMARSRNGPRSLQAS